MSVTAWQFLALFFSGWLYVDAAYRGPVWQRWLFKPLTLLLLLALAWTAPTLGVYGYLIILGLIAALLADGLSLLAKERACYLIGAWSLSHLFYTVAFATQLSFSLSFLLPAILLIIGAVVLSLLWGKLDKLRIPIIAYLTTALLMVWFAGECYLEQGNRLGFSVLLGGLLLLVADILWLMNRYRWSFNASAAVIAGCYFVGHFLIVKSLYP